MTNHWSYKCVNCKNEIPLPEKNLHKDMSLQKQVLPKLCVNCLREAPRESMRPGKPNKK